MVGYAHTCHRLSHTHLHTQHMMKGNTPRGSRRAGTIKFFGGLVVCFLLLTFLFRPETHVVQSPYAALSNEQKRRRDIDSFTIPSAFVTNPAVHVDFNRTLPGVNFIRDRLVAKIGSQTAARETEADLADDRWFWIDDNAKSMEVFIMPGVYEQYKETTDSMVDFILDMSRDGLFLRRKSASKIALKSDNMKDFSVSNGLMDYFGDASALRIVQGYRFHDGRGVAATHTAGFEVSFTCGGEKYHSPGEPFDGFEKTMYESDDKVIVKAVMRIGGKAEVEWRGVMREDTVVSYTYVDVRNIQDKPLENVEVRVKRGLDEHEYSQFCRKYQEKDVKCAPVNGGRHKVLSAEKLEWFSFTVEGRMGFSYGWHHIAKDKSLAEVSIETEGQRVTAFKTVFKKFSVAKGEVFNVEDLGVLTAGGLYKTMPYDKLLKGIEARKELTDFSISYDYGAELSSMSSFAYFMKRRMYKIPDEEQQSKFEELNKWCLEHFEAYHKNFILGKGGRVDKGYGEIFQRGNAMTVISAIKLALINRDNRKIFQRVMVILDDLITCLLKFQHENGMITCDLHGAWFLDCHGAGMLALSYIVATYDVLPYKMDRASMINSLAKSIQGVKYHLHADVVDEKHQHVELKVVVMGENGDDGLQWNYKASLILRALHIMEMTAEDGTQIDSDVLDKGVGLRHYVLGLIEHSKKVSTDNGIRYHEFTTSYRSPETNSETQPWCMLGYHGAYEELYYKLFHDTELSELRLA